MGRPPSVRKIPSPAPSPTLPRSTSGIIARVCNARLNDLKKRGRLRGHFSRVTKGHAMKLLRRQFLQLAGAAAATPALLRRAVALDYPTRPVRWIVPSAPGGTPDITARLIGQWLPERLRQPFVIEDRPGAGANIGAEPVAPPPPAHSTPLLLP